MFSKMPELEGYKAPCFTTVKRWAEKLGYYKLNRPRKRKNGWTVILDASIQMGDQKCLVILGFQSKDLPVGRALRLDDLEVLAVKITNKLTGDKIYEWLKEVQNKFGEIDAICSDRGPDVMKAVRKFLKNYPHSRHVIDTAHRVANFIKAKLENCDRWNSFKKLATQARRTMQNSTVAGAMPPTLRKKARYMNVDSLVKWAEGQLLLLDNPEEISDDVEEFTKYLGWLQDYRREVAQWSMFVSLCDIAKGLVSKNGVYRNLANEFIDEIGPIPLDKEGLDFSDEIVNFFFANTQDVDDDEVYLGSSEIIESLFGKMKCMEGDQTSFGFTSLVLAAVANVGPLDKDIVTAAINTVYVKDIEKWSKEQIGTSVQSYRKKLYRKIRNIKKNIGAKLAGYTGGKAVGF